VVLLFALLVFLVTAIDDTYSTDVGDIRRHALLSLTYVYNWISIYAVNQEQNLFFVGPLWSLSVEEQFYVVWPLVLAGLARWRRNRRFDADGLAKPSSGHGTLRVLIWLALGGVIVSNVLRFVIGVALQNDSSYERALWGTDVNAGALLIGALLALVRLTEPTWYERCKRWLPALIWPSLGIVVAVVFALPEAPSTAPFAGPLLAFHLASAVIIAAVTERTVKPLNAVLELTPLRWIGKISYGAYVFHFFVVTRFEPSVRYPTPTILIMSIAVAAVSFYAIEQPLGRAIRKKFKLD
jgi:peptidoglycan/LPS O-acetylase OafA/YrhL